MLHDCFHDKCISALPVHIVTGTIWSFLALIITFLWEEVVEEGHPAVAVVFLTRRILLNKVKPAVHVVLFAGHDVWVSFSKCLEAWPIHILTHHLIKVVTFLHSIVFKAVPALFIVPFAWRTGQESINPAQIITFKVTRKFIRMIFNHTSHPFFLTCPVLVTTFRCNNFSTHSSIFFLWEVVVKEREPAGIIFIFAWRVLHEPSNPALIVIKCAGEFVLVVHSPCVNTVPVSIVAWWSFRLGFVLSVFAITKEVVGPGVPAVPILVCTRRVSFKPCPPAFVIALECAGEFVLFFFSPLLPASPVLFFAW